jgi:hypothetical protein
VGGVTVVANNGYGLVGIMFAAHPSGSTSVPWNGTTGSLRSGTIGSPVWKASPDNKLAVFPRNNVFAYGQGLFATQRNYMLSLDSNASLSVPATTRGRTHFVLTPDSFTAMSDWNHPGDTTNSYSVLHFGSYTSRKNFTPECKFALLKGNAGLTDDTFFYNGTTTKLFGRVDASNSNINLDGGICTPTLSLSSTRQMFATTIGGNTLDANVGKFNNFVGSGTFEKMPIFIGLRESEDAGIIGYFNELWTTFGVANGTVDTTSSSAVWAGQPLGTVQKYVTLWKGLYPSGTVGSTRTGSLR